MSDSLEKYFIVVGIGTTAFFAFLLFCTVAFCTLLLEDRWQIHRKARFGKHQTMGKVIQLPTSDDVKFFDDLSEMARKEEAKQQEHLAALKKRLTDPSDRTHVNWETEGKAAPLRAVSDEPTQYIAPFNMDKYPNGETLERRGAHKA